MKHFALLLGAGTLALALGACGGGGSTSPTAPTTNKELFEKFVDHQTTNAAEPYNDPTLQGEIQSFTDALRPPTASTDYGKVLASVLYPNEYTVDLSQTGGAAYLGNETGGATSTTKSTFGGRAVTDDVIDISLGAVFGKTLPTLGLVGDDGEENNCLSSENLAQAATQVPTAAFPYLAVPH
jgi:hypothetical protein